MQITENVKQKNSIKKNVRNKMKNSHQIINFKLGKEKRGRKTQ